MNPDKSVIEFKENVTSQFGEDGILREIFNRIGITHRIAVEFGAWDGEAFSNTWDLWHNQGWKAYLFEADAEKCEVLRKNCSAYPNVVPENRFIRAEGAGSLDEVLGSHQLPPDFDLLSIDIDGDDYHIWKNLRNFRPRVVIIEHNPTIPGDYDVVQLPGGCMGSSARAIFNLAKSLDYGLVAATLTNLIFVERSVLASGSIQEKKLDEVLPKKELTYLITDYQGNTYLSNWPGFDIKAKKLTFFNAVKTALRYRPSAWRRVVSEPRLIPVKVFKTDVQK